MRRFILIAAAALFLGLAADTAGQRGDRRLQGLIDAERAFSAMSEEKGVREAFLTYLADDSIVFRPKPVPGKAAYENMPTASSAVLTWNPEYAEISCAGDLGFTTGPYQARDRATRDRPPRFGHYVSVWERQANGEWKVSLDAGISHPQPGMEPGTVASLPEGAPRRRGPRVDRNSERTELLNEEARFAQVARSKSLMEAYLDFAADDVRLCRDGALPVLGKTALLKTISVSSRKYDWGPADAVVSSTGDLGYVFGEAEGVSADKDAPFETSSFLRIWRRLASGGWRIALDLAIPVSAEPGSNL